MKTQKIVLILLFGLFTTLVTKKLRTKDDFGGGNHVGFFGNDRGWGDHEHRWGEHEGGDYGYNNVGLGYQGWGDHEHGWGEDH